MSRGNAETGTVAVSVEVRDEHGELVRKRTAELLGPDDELLIRGPPSTREPEFKVMCEKLLAAAMVAKGKP